MDDDETRPISTQEATFPRKLEGVSVEALQDYLVALDEEKERVNAELKSRAGLHSAAEDVFRKG